MEIALDPATRRFIEQKVRNGAYPSAEAVVQAGLASLRQQEEFGEFAAGELDKLLADGEQSIATEGTLDGDEALAARRAGRAQ